MKAVAQQYIDFLPNFEVEQLRELCDIIEAHKGTQTNKGFVPYMKKDLIKSIRMKISSGVNDNKLFRFTDLAKQYFEQLQ